METKLFIMGIGIVLCFIFLIAWSLGYVNLETIIEKCYKINNQIFSINSDNPLSKNSVVVNC